MNPLVRRLVPPLGAAYLRFILWTSRYRQEGLENLKEALGEKNQAIWVCWHNRLIGAIPLHADRNMGAVISKSGDGELIANAVERLGYKALRGSTSRGGSEVLRAVLRHAKAGYDLVFTPDGPRGPWLQVQPGVAFVAQRTGLAVIPVGVGATRKIVFRSRDRFQLPLPFGRVQVVYGKPLRFSGDESLEEVQETIRAELQRVTEEADRLLGVSSP